MRHAERNCRAAAASVRLKRTIRQTKALARAFQSPHSPVVAQIIPTRRCNLSCAYCNEFDRTSDPVPLDALRELRARPVETLQPWFGTPGSFSGVPAPVRLLLRLLVTGPERRLLRGAARRLLGIQN